MADKKPRRFAQADDLRERDAFLASSVSPIDVAEQTSLISRHKVRNGKVQIATVVDALPEFVITNVEQADSERLQGVMNLSDAGKLYFFGHQVRVYAISGFMYDSDHDDTRWHSRGHARLREFYETSRLSELARRHELIRVQYGERILYGALTEADVRMDTTHPTMVNITMPLYVVWEQLSEPLGDGITFASGEHGDDALQVPMASLSRQGAEMAGISYRPGFIRADMDSLTDSLRDPVPIPDIDPRVSAGVV